MADNSNGGDDSDWDDWTEQMLGAAEGSPPPKSSTTSPEKPPQAEDLSEEKWIQGMEASSDASPVKDDDDPVWTRAARLAGGLVVAKITTIPQYNALLLFLQQHSPLADYLLASINHFLFATWKFTWFALCNTNGVCGVAVAGVRPRETNIYASIFCPEEKVFIYRL